MTRWRCRNDRCERRIFAERLPALTAPFARRTARLAGIVRLFGHGAGGRPSERLMTRLGMPVSDTTILRDWSARSHAYPVHVRVAGIDDWAWRKGDEVLGKTHKGLLLRNQKGRIGEVEWHRMIDQSTNRLQLGFGYAFTVDAAQGVTSDEHINAMARGSAGANAFKTYVPESRATE